MPNGLKSAAHPDELDTAVAAQVPVADALALPRTVIVVPVNAPLPQLLADHQVTGSLLDRLQALEGLGAEGPRVLPLSGDEVIALDRAWPLLRACADQDTILVHMTEIPATRYDILYTQGVRVLGLKALAWPDLEIELSQLAASRQAVGDKQPWLRQEHVAAQVSMRADESKPKVTGSRGLSMDRSTAEPEDDINANP